VAAFLLLLAAAPVVANPIDRMRPDAPELAVFGDYPIGVQTLNLTHPGQIDVLAERDGQRPLYDRPLTIEVWYPAAAPPASRGEYETVIRDGQTPTTLTGRAQRDAPPATGAAFPLVVLSHGYPGNRYLMAHFGENLASKGFVVAAIDHTDSTYRDQAALGATLYHRPLDQRFVIDHFAKHEGQLGRITDTERVGVIGYAMGAYGALVFGGAGVTEAATELTWGPPDGMLAQHMAGSDTHEALIDPRLRAIVAIGPWGRNAGLWDAGGMAGLRVPTLFMAGSRDDVSVYEAMRTIFTESTGTDRHLLTFENANHNAAAPIPAPQEAWEPSEALDFVPFEHYADPVWDTRRMNNIAQHFVTAFFDLHLKGDLDRNRYLDLIPNGADGLIALDEDGKPTEDHTYWAGFAPRTAQGLRFETMLKDQ
jgi:predicted dienelactone hydrolase